MIIILGKFESFHLGHQKLIDVGKNLSKKLGLPLKILALNPLPYEVFFKNYIPIYTPEERRHIAENKFLTSLDFLDFRKIKDLKPLEFLKFLKINYNFKYIVVGKDFFFGKNRQGSYLDLKKYENILNYKAILVDLEKVYKEKISTSKIRNLLKEGKIDIANKYLNHFYFLFGKVIKGSQVGRKLGFPTANISCKKLLLKRGVYKVYIYIKEDFLSFKAIANFGKKPTFGENKDILEVHIPNVKLNLYGKNVIVWFEKFIREEKKFKSLEELKKQIEKDIRELEKD